jgi:hypothetical protein
MNIHNKLALNKTVSFQTRSSFSNKTNQPNNKVTSKPTNFMKQILLEKVIISELAKKFPTFYKTRRYNYRVPKKTPIASILNQTKSVHTLTPYFVLNTL